MIYKKRKKPTVLAMLEVLYKRAQLSAKVHKYYMNQKKGYYGECCFDVLTEKLECDCLILNDLPFQDDGNEFQIDALIITAYAIYLYEIKNYEGTYYYKDGFFRSVFSDFKFESPIEWLNRKETYLQKILYEYGINLPIKSFIVFVHPEFTLYDVSYSERVLLPTYIPQHFRQTNQLDGKLTQEHIYVASKLCEVSAQSIPTLKGVPSYEYDELKKGLICENCGEFIHEVKDKDKTITCAGCGYREVAAECIFRHIEEYKMMFPGRRVAFNLVDDWCGGLVTVKRIRYVFKKYYQAHGSGRGRYYE
ncbi:nuclease-related domain-containing protein [Desemzia sp. FAM 24101]|uniref:nuclease-related domain-containing protein n=1 Tax=unclassified Desemzia TaxID=2685243 RepID=UPI00388ACCA2